MEAVEYANGWTCEAQWSACAACTRSMQKGWCALPASLTAARPHHTARMIQ